MNSENNLNTVDNSEDETNAWTELIEERREDHRVRGGKVYEEEHGGSKFLLRDALGYVVDNYDEALASTELSHHEKLGYREVTEYELAPGTDTLDLTWMDEDDTFNFTTAPQHASVKQLEVNVDNIAHSYMMCGEEYFHDLKLVIHNGDSKANPVAKIKAVRSFLDRNGEAFSDNIQFEGFSPALAKIFEVIKQKSLEGQANQG